jgi:hypothetical protein
VQEKSRFISLLKSNKNNKVCTIIISNKFFKNLWNIQKYKLAFLTKWFYIWIRNVLWKQTCDILFLLWRHVFTIDIYVVKILYAFRRFLVYAFLDQSNHYYHNRNNLFFLVPTVFRIQFCLAFDSKKENGMLSLLWKALLNYTWYGWQCTFFGFVLFCYTINRNYRNKNIYIFLSVSIYIYNLIWFEYFNLIG